MEKQNIRIENPWYGMINSPEQKKRAKRRMKKARRVYRAKTAMWVILVECLVLAAVLAGLLVM